MLTAFGLMLTTVLIVVRNTPPVAYIDGIYPNPATEDAVVYFRGHGEDKDGTVTGYEWSCDLHGVLSTKEDFSSAHRRVSKGKHVISFRVQDDDAAWSKPVQGTLFIVTENRSPTAHIDAIYPNPATEEAVVYFRGHGEDKDGTVTGYEWSSDVDGVLSTKEDFSSADRRINKGKHVISFRVRDEDGAWSKPIQETLLIIEVSTIEVSTLELKPFILNLADDSSYLKITIALGYGVVEQQKLLEDKSTQIRDAILTILSSKSSKTLSTKHGKMKLKDDIKEALDNISGLRGVVTSVYFTDFQVL